MGSEDQYFQEMMARLGVAPKSKQDPSPTRKALPRKTEPEENDEAERRLFLEAVGALPEGDPLPEPEPEPEKRGNLRAETPHTSEEVDRALFLDAMARLGDVDKDDFAPAVPTAEKGRKPIFQRLPKRATVEWDDQLDLHGMSVEQAMSAVASFVAKSYAGNARVIAIITGKGRGSPSGIGVLGPAVDNWIRMMGGRYVRSFAHAPRAQGGRGTLILYLNRT